MTDEELQRQIENGQSGLNSADAQAYRKVFEAVKKEPWNVPVDLADRVMRSIGTTRSVTLDDIWMYLGVVCIVLAGIATALILPSKLNLQILRLNTGYNGLIIFGIFFVLLLHWLDKSVIQKKLHERS